MLKKLKAIKPGDTQQIVDTVRANAQQVWLAGLGAFAAVHAEGNKVINTAQSEGAKVFAALVKQGQQIEASATNAVVKQAGAFGDKTTQAVDKLEQVFQERVSRSLSRLGIPSNKDVHALTARVEDLSKTIKTLVESKTPARAPRKTARA
jgi:poly(hydroxyalkanoate) granule-associated protein